LKSILGHRIDPVCLHYLYEFYWSISILLSSRCVSCRRRRSDGGEQVINQTPLPNSKWEALGLIYPHYPGYTIAMAIVKAKLCSVLGTDERRCYWGVTISKVSKVSARRRCTFSNFDETEHLHFCLIRFAVSLSVYCHDHVIRVPG
jgi:hypothetical protein